MKITFSAPDQLFWLVFILSIFVLFYTFMDIGFLKRLRPILFFRFAVVILLVLLFLEPKIEFNKEKTSELNWNIYIDRSLSMSYHSHPSSISFVSGIDEFGKKIDQRGIRSSIIGFGSEIDSIWSLGNKKLDGISTNIGLVMNHMEDSNYHGIAGAVIFTDGQVNLGTGIPTEVINKRVPIHVVGIGDANPMVDVEVHSIDAPPLVIKGEEADLDVTVLSHGQINERGNVTLYQGNKLIGSKVISLSGGGSQEKVRFRLKPSMTGRANYRVQVNALAEEINIKNNKQTVQIQVLKDEYRIAVLTGAPNFNTNVLKRIIISNPEIALDHFIYRQNGFQPPLKQFWDKQYDLILFDNHPIAENHKIWKNYLKVFAKKLVSHQSNLGIIFGPDMDETTVKEFLSLVDIKLSKQLLEKDSPVGWTLTENWLKLFPFNSISGIDRTHNEFPPLLPGLEIDSAGTKVLANYTSSNVEVPLLLTGQKNSLRFFVWTSPDMYALFYRTQGTLLSGLLGDMVDPILGWLLNTGGDQEIYFRTNKNSYQQGERIELTGKPLHRNQFVDEGVVNIYLNEKLISTKPMIYDPGTGLFRSRFWASQSGTIGYEVEFDQSGKSHLMGRGSFQVQESQIELNNVYLNEKPLQRLAEVSNGVYKNWDRRNDIISLIQPVSRKQSLAYIIVLNENILFFICILGLLTSEWIIRRRIGLM
ncbi:MAG: hypothetical protein QGG04_05160 [Candidatus Marinimicrobia bacterium]|nr:hypothetical protein [Candidatus Neomarinimicrobiota bacterium]